MKKSLYKINLLINTKLWSKSVFQFLIYHSNITPAEKTYLPNSDFDQKESVGVSTI